MGKEPRRWARQTWGLSHCPPSPVWDPSGMWVQLLHAVRLGSCCRHLAASSRPPCGGVSPSPIATPTGHGRCPRACPSTHPQEPQASTNKQPTEKARFLRFSKHVKFQSIFRCHNNIGLMSLITSWPHFQTRGWLGTHTLLLKPTQTTGLSGHRTWSFRKLQKATATAAASLGARQED